MPSPDVRPYVDLTLLDANEQTIINNALAIAVGMLPGWVPREGNVEVILMEAIASMVAEGIFAINRIPGTIVEVLLQLYGVVRDVGAQSQGTVTFGLSDSQGRTVPAGTRVATVDGRWMFTTDTNLVVPAGQTSGSTSVTCTVLTSATNGIAVGTVLTLVDAIPYVDTVRMSGATVGGRDVESDTVYFARSVQTLGRLVSTLVLPAHFEAAALAVAGVYRARAVDNYDPTSGHAPGGDPGHVTVAVLDPAGAPLTAGAKTALHTVLAQEAMAALAVHIIDPTVTAVSVTCTVVAKAGQTVGTVQTAVSAALAAYLNVLTWGWAATVRRFDLIALLSAVPGVAYVSTVSSPSADVVLSGAAPLASLGALSVTVQPWS